MYRIVISSLLYMMLIPAFAEQDVAIFAGGRFWFLEADFKKVSGVISTVAGFDGGQVQFPTYVQVNGGTTHYAQAVKVIYDKDQVSYRKLVEYYFKHIDPTVQDEQFCDKGSQYRTAIFYMNDKQRNIALDVRDQVAQKFNTIYTQITPTKQFYPAEDYHQAYYKKNPIRYKYYRYQCGRDAKIAELWGDLP